MNTFLIPVIDYGASVAMTGESYGSLKAIVRDLVKCQFNYFEGRGLLRVAELDADTMTSEDVSSDVAKAAIDLIKDDAMNADGNVLRFLQEHGDMPEWVAAIEEGRFLAADLAHAA